MRVGGTDSEYMIFQGSGAEKAEGQPRDDPGNFNLTRMSSASFAIIGKLSMFAPASISSN